MNRALARLSVLAFVMLGLAALGLASCAPSNEATPGASGPPAVGATPAVGSVSFELTLGGTYKLDTISYEIDGNGFHRGASVNVAASSTFSTVVSEIPVGTGYMAKLTARDTAMKLTPCVGSAAFDVTGGATADVPVHMTCHVVPTTTPPPPPPPSVPVPRGAAVALAALLAAVGAARLRRPSA